MFVGLKNATVHISGKQYVIKKNEEIKPGIVRVFQGINRMDYIAELPDSYLDRQMIWIRTIQKETGETLLGSVYLPIFKSYIPDGKKVGQWCCGKIQKIVNAVVKQFPDVIVPIANEHKNQHYKWDGPVYYIIIDETKLDVIENYINLQCALSFA